MTKAAHQKAIKSYSLDSRVEDILNYIKTLKLNKD